MIGTWTPEDADMTEYEHSVQCFLCKQSFQFGPHRYAGNRIPAWDMMVCDVCRNSNWDGIVPSSHPDLLPCLESKGIKVRTNSKGWIDLPN
jgi:hypothetical protein